MKLELPDYVNSQTALLTLGAAALSMAACVYKNQLATWRLPFIKDVVFLISTTLSKLEYLYNSAEHPYITDFGLLSVGGMPYRDNTWFSPMGNNLMKKLLSPAQNLGLVVSMVQPHEQAGTGLRLFGKQLPIQPASWQTNGIKHHACPMQDLSTNIENAQAHKAIDAMHKTILSGKSVYLHCQAGQGRSFIMLMSYFLTHGEPRFENSGDGTPQVVHNKFAGYEVALKYIKSVRQHVLDTPARRAKIEEIVGTYQQSNTQPTSEITLSR
ncbi:MAG: hypothetical protein P1U63_10420 [Coxiellaceae bacterium]|nr:hypothetical protein [Coxiellaceae bacterium]